jgi:hypothetical protein
MSDKIHVELNLTPYELSALRLFIRVELDRTERDHTGPGSDDRPWPAAMRAVVDQLTAPSTPDARNDTTVIVSRALEEIRTELPTDQGEHLAWNPHTERHETGGDEIEFADESAD